MSPVDADELMQVAERALFDAEEAYRLDPSDANQRRVTRARSAVRKARGRPREDKTDSSEPPATPGD
jgi:hypothetical protein